MASSHKHDETNCPGCNNCPCCNSTALSPDAVFLTIWYKWDREQERGAGRWCDNIDDALARFVQLRQDDKICAALIDRDNKAIMSWDIDWVHGAEQPTKPKKESNKKKSKRNNPR